MIADADAEHLERALLNEYKEKLIVGTRTLPDPLTLKVGWEREDEDGLTKWLQYINFSDISDYLKTKTEVDLR